MFKYRVVNFSVPLKGKILELLPFYRGSEDNRTLIKSNKNEEDLSQTREKIPGNATEGVGFGFVFIPRKKSNRFLISRILITF